MDIIFFVYGLAFILLGVVIFVLPKRHSEYQLAGFIGLLAGFGFVHGLLEWADLWKILKGGSPFLSGLRITLLIASFLLLTEFSRRLLRASLNAQGAPYRLLSPWLYAALLPLLAAGTLLADDPLLGADIWTRYLFGFTASCGAGIGLHVYFRERVAPVLSARERPSTRRYFALGSAAFVGYGICTGLVVPAAAFFPADTFNYPAFLAATGVPVQAFRALCAVLAALAVSNILCIFHFEGRDKLVAALARSQSLLDELQHINHQHELILQTAAEGIIGIDRRGNVVFVNRAALALLGYRDIGEMAGANLHALIHHTNEAGQPNSVEQCPMHLSLRDGMERRATGEIFWRRDGTSFPVEFACAPLRDAADPLGAVIVFQNITVRKQNESALLRLNQELEHRVAEEVEKNREKEHHLFQQSRLASMGEMIGYIAHQWRQPLNTIGLVLANIMDAHRFGDLDEAYLSEQVATGSRLVQQMSTTIDDFRKFFRPSATQEHFDVAEAVRRSLSLVEASFQNHGFAVELTVDTQTEILGYANEFQQVVVNLLNNAQDIFLERQIANGKVRVAVSRNGDELRVAVSDNGGGIPEDIRHKIFDPYFTTRVSGTGIGLYMAKIIVEKHMGGRIEARNGAEGAEFALVFPLSENAAGA
ncbi:MAG: PAS domain-containing protein [Sulfuricella sp.]|nr:PAS domain-containing protein [Sulfuricella sp.]